jgi:transmembrane sensor
MQKMDAKKLLIKFREGKASEQEKALLDTWYLGYRKGEGLQIPEKEYELSEELMWKGLVKDHLEKKPRPVWFALGAAAAMLLVLGIGFYFIKSGKPVSDSNYSAAANKIAPGRQGATLTLASGKKIRLADAANGKLADQSGVRIVKTADGKLVYQVTSAAGDPAELNTLSTANGQTYTVVLPDGSKVTLNAASSLSYPSSFAALDARQVELSGEGYFEIAKDKHHPFVVRSNGQQVKVLGTHFNINSYPEEGNTQTTLIEGSLLINNKILIRPGEQAQGSGAALSVKPADTSNVLAWKDGYFQFDQQDLGTILRRVSRWYDVQIVYQDSDRAAQLFSGAVSRYANIAKVLDALAMSQEVKFKIEGRRVTVTK